MNGPRLAGVSRKRRWTGRILAGLIGAALALDALGKFMKPEAVVKGTVALGYPESVILPLGVVLLASVILYIVPRTAIVGAILLTGYLGGAVASHVRLGDPMFTHVLFPVYAGVIVWVGLTLRDPRLAEALFPRTIAEP